MERKLERLLTIEECSEIINFVEENPNWDYHNNLDSSGNTSSKYFLKNLDGNDLVINKFKNYINSNFPFRVDNVNIFVLKYLQGGFFHRHIDRVEHREKHKDFVYNINVILNDEVAGIVYNTDKKKYEPMSKKDIIMQSMDKVFKHLKIFYDDIINNNINELSPYLLENIKKEFDHKYKIFFELSSSQETVNNTFTYIYNNKKDDSCKKYNEYINNKETNKKLGY